MELLLRHRAPALPPYALAEVFDRLLWCLDDDGHALMSIVEEWLLSDNRDRVEIALAMNEAFPFREAEEMERALAGIALRWPELTPRCQELAALRRSQTRA
ncbi:MAG: hypothetical protein H6741_26615 [Alphaproteobacteria bacterium]|nr:hypothetical protein [Alphaproteobacteria bacterium]